MRVLFVANYSPPYGGGIQFVLANLTRRLLARGKLKFLPHFARRNRRSKKSAASPRAVGYFPGCSLSATSIEYGRSVRSVASALDIELMHNQKAGRARSDRFYIMLLCKEHRDLRGADCSQCTGGCQKADRANEESYSEEN